MYRYYEILDSNEKEGKLSEEDIKKSLLNLSVCKEFDKGGDKCYLNFYRDYTIKHGPINSLRHLSLMMVRDPGLVPGCHYVAHGIGEGIYINNNYDLQKSYAFPIEKYFSNLTTCGNGFSHGIGLGLTKRIKSLTEFERIFSKHCEDKSHWGGVGKESCNHGVGHAVMAYTDNDIPKSVEICKSMFPNGRDAFACLTGVEMEEDVLLFSYGVLDFGIESLQNTCSKYAELTQEREACIVEKSGRLAYDKEKKIYNNFSQRMLLCERLSNIDEVKACSKLTIIHSIRIARSQEAKKICSLLKDKETRIECTMFFAGYLGSAIGKTDKVIIKKVNREACRTLDYLEYVKCIEILESNRNRFGSNMRFNPIPSYKGLLKRVYSDIRIHLGI